MRQWPILRRAGAALLLGALLAGTAGCVRIGSKPPNQLLAIEMKAQIEPDKDLSGPTENALFVEAPQVAKAIDTQRIAVRALPTSYAYVKKALWVDTPANQFQALLSETISANTDRMVLDPDQYPPQSGHILNGVLLDFGIDAQTQQAIVTFDATLLRADGMTVRRQRFSASRPVNKIDADSVAQPISAAANEVAAAVAAWVSSAD